MRPMHHTEPNTLRRTSIFLAWVLAGVMPLHPASADAQGEREALARVVHELQAIEPLLRRGEAQANPDARVRFRYDWLRQDLQRMRFGIQEHIDAPRAEPRSFPPLRGEYRW